MIQMRTNDLVSLYVSFVETNGGRSRSVLIRRVSEQTVEVFKITSQYEKEVGLYQSTILSDSRLAIRWVEETFLGRSW